MNKICTTVPLEGSEEDRKVQTFELKRNPNYENYPLDVMHAYAQNVCCDEWNEYRLKLLPGREFTNIPPDSKKVTVLNLQMLQCLSIHMKQVIWKSDREHVGQEAKYTSVYHSINQNAFPIHQTWATFPVQQKKNHFKQQVSFH